MCVCPLGVTSLLLWGVCLLRRRKVNTPIPPPPSQKHTLTHTHKQEGLSPNVIELERARVKRDHPPSAES